MQAFSAAGQEMYQSQAAEASAEGGQDAGATAEEPSPAGQGAKADEDVVEADYEIVDDK
jgi:hypothetical protein